MDARRRVIVTLAVVVAACLPALRAEVAATTDTEGRCLGVVVRSNSSSSNPWIWKVRGELHEDVPLNGDGDLFGDGWPVILEDPLDEGRPKVVWSRFNGEGYDLAWSEWRDGAWSEIRWLDDTPTLDDDIDPSADLDPRGRAHVVWWSDEMGVGRVYLSVFLNTRWTRPFPVSEPGVDSRYPLVVVDAPGEVRIEYESTEGPETRYVLFEVPGTITDEANPFGSMRVYEEGEDPEHGQDLSP